VTGRPLVFFQTFADRWFAKKSRPRLTKLGFEVFDGGKGREGLTDRAVPFCVR